MSFFATNEDIIRRGQKLSSGGITSVNGSSYEIINTHRTDEGDFLHLRIIARDRNKHPRHSGGDFWTATLTSASGNYSTSGKIEDHFNGTYSVYFISAWDGRSYLNISLIHASETVQYLRYVVWPIFRLYYDGYYILGNIESRSVCTIVSTSEHWLDKCVYSHPEALGNHLFICDIPDNKNLSCANFVDYGQVKGGKRLELEGKVVRKLYFGKERLFQK